MKTSIEALQRWEIPDLVHLEPRGGLIRICVTSRIAEAHVYVQGAHVTHYRPAGQPPLLFTSEQSKFAPGKAIRGGVPVIFPWFGAFPDKKDLPMHGFARTTEWEIEAIERWQDDTVELVFRLVADDETRA